MSLLGMVCGLGRDRQVQGLGRLRVHLPGMIADDKGQLRAVTTSFTLWSCPQCRGTGLVAISGRDVLGNKLIVVHARCGACHGVGFTTRAHNARGEVAT